MWLILTLCGGIVLAGLSLFMYNREAQRATTKGGGGFESHQVPMYPMLTGLSVCIFLICISLSRETTPILTDCSIAALLLYFILYFGIHHSLKIRRDAVSRTPQGTEVRVAEDFRPNKRDLAGTTAEGVVLLEGKKHPAFVRILSESDSTDYFGTADSPVSVGAAAPLKIAADSMPKRGDILYLEDTDEFYLICTRSR